MSRLFWLNDKQWSKIGTRPVGAALFARRDRLRS